jgi:hypothetical protein
MNDFRKDSLSRFVEKWTLVTAERQQSSTTSSGLVVSVYRPAGRSEGWFFFV